MISLICQCFEYVLSAVAQHIQRWVKPDNPSLFADAALDLTRSKTELILENAFLRQQLIVLNRQVKRPALKLHQRVLLVRLTSRLRSWRQALITVQPETLLRWRGCGSANHGSDGSHQLVKSRRRPCQGTYHHAMGSRRACGSIHPLKENGAQIHGRLQRFVFRTYRRPEVQRVVVLVDDLDRCLPSAVMATLEAIKLFLSVRKMVFVIAADQDTVRDAIATSLDTSRRSERFASRYLEKIVQLPVSLPRLAPHEAEAYLAVS